MPEVPDVEGAFFAEPDSQEAMHLDERWAAGEFAARLAGKLLFASRILDGPPAKSIVILVPKDPSIAEVIRKAGLAGLHIAESHQPPAQCFLPIEQEWNIP